MQHDGVKVPSETERSFLEALESRSVPDVERLVAVFPSLALSVRPCRQPTVHYAFSCGSSVSPSCIACIQVLLANGAPLDAVDPSNGNTVFHTLIAPRADGGFADDCANALLWLLAHPQRPSLHVRNVLGLTAIEYAVRVGNIAAVDWLVATPLSKEHTRCVASSTGAQDEALEKLLLNLPIALVMGAQQTTSGSISFPFRGLLLFAAQFGETAMIRYLLSVRINGALAGRIRELEGRTSANSLSADQVRVFELQPPAWDEEATSKLWRKIGTPLQLCCGSCQPGKTSEDPIIKHLTAVDFMLAWIASEYATADETEEEERRRSERFHDHIPQRTPAAVIAALRARDENGRCAMHYAADGKFDGTLAVMQRLYEVDSALLQQADAGGRTSLDCALRSKKTKNAEWMLQEFGTGGLSAQPRVRGGAAAAFTRSK